MSEIKMVQWARVLKLVRDAKKSTISIYGLAKTLDVEKGSEALEKTLQMLQKRGDIKIAMGITELGIVGRVAYIPKEVEDSRAKFFKERDEK